MTRKHPWRTRTRRLLVTLLFVLATVALIAPHIGGTRQPRKMLSEATFVLEVSRADDGTWSCRPTDGSDSSITSNGLEEAKPASPSDAWVVQIDQIAIHWLGFVPGTEELAVSWRPMWAVPPGEQRSIVPWTAARPPNHLLDAVRRHVESTIVPRRDFPMAERVADAEIAEVEPLVWVASKRLSHPATFWGVASIGLLVLGLVGYAIAFAVVPEQPVEPETARDEATTPA